MNDRPVPADASQSAEQQRFEYVDQFRGFIVILMLVDHCSFYFNSSWRDFDPFEPVFTSSGQAALRYASYLCAPGFLIISGSMIWLSYHNRLKNGFAPWAIRWQIIQRGLFLVLLQIIWVNSAWGGFRAFKPWHFGIIGCIGISMILLSAIVHLRWQLQLLIALGILVIHPLLLKIPYNPDIDWQLVVMQTFVDAGKFNKYPVLPWFAMATLGSVMASGWMREWKTDKQRILMSVAIAMLAIGLAIAIRLVGGYGNIFSWSRWGSISFFIDQKYPPSLYFSLSFFGLVILVVAAFMAIGRIAPRLLIVFTIPGKVALFFYVVHIAVLGLFSRRLGLFYRDGDVISSLFAAALMLAIMLPLCHWFYRVKQRSRNYVVRML